jgi:hypothetical protein
MLKYVREQLEKQGVFAESAVFEDDELDDNLFTEAAHVLDELSEVSPEGTEDSDAVRKISGISIPVEDDFEIDTVEFCMSDGRITDIPGDATLQESYYKSLKSKMDFYQEAVDTTMRLPRESDEVYEDRVYKKMNSLYNEYMEYIVQEGLFGFGEIKLSDPSVVWNVHICFGKLKREGNSEYTVSLPVFYEAPKKKILKKQLDCIKYWDYCRLVNAYDDLTKFANDNNIKLPKDGNIWDVFKPEKVCVPREPKDSYKIFIVIKNLSDGNELWFTIEHKIKEASKANASSQSPDMADSKTVSLEIKRASAPSANFVDKKTFTESFVEFPSRWNDVYQEAINFGGAGAPPEMAGAQPEAAPQAAAPAPEAAAPPMPAPDNAQPANNQPSAQDINVNIDNGENPPEMNAEPQGDQPADPPAPENPNVNDVTDRIADGVNDALAQQNIGDDVDLSADVNEEPNFDLNATPDNPTLDAAPTDVDPTNIEGTGDVESSIPDSDVDSEIDDDFDNMTLNQLIEQAQEKAKDMTLDQLKSFLRDNTMPDGQSVGNVDTAEPVDVEDVQEGVFRYSRANINDTLDVLLRNALGILNNNNYDLSKLLKEFRKNGKKLNKALNQAVKYENIYNEQEKKQMQLLNRCLCDLMSMVKDNSSASNTQTAKRLVKAFCSQAKAVGAIIDAHKSTKPVNDSTEGGKNNG